jgi:hypothetical protein
MSINRRRLFFRLGLALAALLMFVQACSLPFNLGPTPVPGADQTEVAMMVKLTALQAEVQNAQATLTQVAGIPTNPPAAPPIQTPTPTETLAPTWTPIYSSPTIPVIVVPTVLVVTATPYGVVPPVSGGGQPTIIARVNSNCRAGPSSLYLRLGYLLVGESSIVLGRNSDWSWWYIREPRRNLLCWVWAGSTSVQGDTASLPIVKTTAVPVYKATSTKSSTSAAFSITGVKMIKCGGEFTIMVRVTNNGKQALESASLQVYNLTKSKNLFGPSTSNSPFRTSDSDCSAGGDRLEPGKSLYIGAGLGTQSLYGNRLEINVGMCTEEGFSGKCDWDEITYKVP